MAKTIYVTFQVKPTEFCRAMGFKTLYFAIECHGEEQARAAAADVNSIDGVTYIRFNHCLRSRHKDLKVIHWASDYAREIAVYGNSRRTE